MIYLKVESYLSIKNAIVSIFIDGNLLYKFSNVKKLIILVFKCKKNSRNN